MLNNLCRTLACMLSFTFLTACSDSLWGCGKKITRTEAITDELHLVYLAEDCGATTIPSINLYLVPSDKMNSIETDNFQKRYFVARFQRGKITLTQRNNVIVIQYDNDTEFFRKRNMVNGYQIVYTQKSLEKYFQQ